MFLPHKTLNLGDLIPPSPLARHLYQESKTAKHSVTVRLRRWIYQKSYNYCSFIIWLSRRSCINIYEIVMTPSTRSCQYSSGPSFNFLAWSLAALLKEVLCHPASCHSQFQVCSVGAFPRRFVPKNSRQALRTTDRISFPLSTKA
jgi:hypothetical protein